MSAAGSGQACNVQTNQFCQTGLSCIVEGITSMTCGAGNAASGAICHLSFPDMCAPGFYCNGPNATMGHFDGTCAPLPTVGMPCAMGAAGQSCADEMTCEAGMCVQIEENGGACTSDSDCFGSHCGGTGTCTAPTYCPS